MVSGSAYNVCPFKIGFENTSLKAIYVSSLCVGLYRWLVKVSWLGKLVSVFWWVELDFFSLKCNEVYSSEF